jgi:FkbM family methyltransferase
MKKVYIDCGSHDGGSITEFLQSASIFIKRADASVYKIYAVEPNAGYHKLQEKFPTVEVLASAAWLYDGEVEFKNAEGSLSSCVSQYTMQCYDESYSQRTVFPCFDLAQFILNLDAEYIVLKMDVESAEYDLIPRLIETKAINKINEIYVEFHHPGNLINEKAKADITDYIRQHCSHLQFFDNWP